MVHTELKAVVNRPEQISRLDSEQYYPGDPQLHLQREIDEGRARAGGGAGREDERYFTDQGVRTYERLLWTKIPRWDRRPFLVSDRVFWIAYRSSWIDDRGSMIVDR